MCKDPKQKEAVGQPVPEEQPEPAAPEEPKNGELEEPERGEPEESENSEPEEPERGEPEGSENGEPEEPERGEPEGSKDGEPEERQTDVRVRAQSGFVIKPKMSAPESCTVQTVTADRFLRDHPGLTIPKGLGQRREPLLIITHRAEREIKTHIGWARKTPQNVREQGGILIGTPFLVDGHMVSVVECVIPAELYESSAAYLKMDTKTWIKMLNLYDERYRDQGLHVVGWFHTHPNGLGVFMSSTDMGTQRAFFREDWHFAVVLNPHRRLIACFHSAQAIPCAFTPSDFTDR